MTTPPPVTLTDGEKTVLEALAHGMQHPAEIAREYGMPDRDVRQHLADLMTKLGVYEIGLLLNTAIERGLVRAGGAR